MDVTALGGAELCQVAEGYVTKIAQDCVSSVMYRINTSVHFHGTKTICSTQEVTHDMR